MKKIVKGILLLSLVCFSFFYTDKVMDIVDSKTPLMQKLISVKSDYDVLPVNAIASGNTVIPGLKGREINISKSYDNMKIGGVFREDALIFSDLYPNSSLSDNIDKYIIKGNSIKNEVSLLIIVSENNISKVSQINNITLFLNHKDITAKNINNLKEKEIYSYGNNGKYKEDDLVSDNLLINRLSNNKSIYCLAKSANDDTLKICMQNKMYTVIPNIIGGYYNIKNNLSNGSIILLDNLVDVELTIKFIESKGYKIVPLSKLLEE